MHFVSHLALLSCCLKNDMFHMNKEIQKSKKKNEQWREIFWGKWLPVEDKKMRINIIHGIVYTYYLFDIN